MEFYILDKSFNSVYYVDDYESLIWTDRFNSAGEFEIHSAASLEVISAYLSGYYVWYKGSDHLMIIENHKLESDEEGHYKYTTTGRSLESLLDRRIVWAQTTAFGNLQAAVKKLITDAIISPSIAARKIPNFVFKDSTDTRITALKIDTQYTGDNLYEVITNICADNGIGFKITLNKSNQFVFELYLGTDRTWNQNTNPYVIFSPKMDNLMGSTYSDSTANYKTVALIGGEGEGTARKFTTQGGGTGLDRRELFVDARDVSSEDGDTHLTAAQYTAVLAQRGREKLADYPEESNFEGSLAATGGFIYGRDFFMGDCVQVENEFGLTGESVVTEMIFAQDSDGFTAIPTFDAV